MHTKKIAENIRAFAEQYNSNRPDIQSSYYTWLNEIANELDPPAPKPLLADAKVGDLCQRRDGKYVLIESVSYDRPCQIMCKSDIGGQDCFTLDGRNHNAVNDSKDIIITEPLAAEGSAEWAWQMAKLGIETKCSRGKIRISKSGMIEVCYGGMAYAMPMTQSPENRQYVINKMRKCSPDGWQLYGPKPEPEPKPEHPAINGYNRYDYIPVEGIRQPKPEPRELTMKFETINGTLCRMVEPTPLQPDSPMPCIARIVQDDTAMGKYNRSRYCAEALVKKHLITDVSYGGFVLIESGKVYASECWQYEIIGYPVADGSKDWALYQMMQGLKVCNPQLAKSKAARLGCDGEIFNTYWYVVGDTVVEGKGDYGTLSVSSWIAAASSTGWQLYEELQLIDSGRWTCFECGVKDSRKGHFPGCSRDGSPKPTFKVGDWVEHKESKEQGRITYISSANYDAVEVKLYDTDELETYTVSDFNAEFRKLDPSEVVIHIGCLSGTIKQSGDPAAFILMPICKDGGLVVPSIIAKDMLDTPTRVLVQSVLKAQEEI